MAAMSVRRSRRPPHMALSLSASYSVSKSCTKSPRAPWPCTQPRLPGPLPSPPTPPERPADAAVILPSRQFGPAHACSSLRFGQLALEHSHPPQQLGVQLLRQSRPPSLGHRLLHGVELVRRTSIRAGSSSPASSASPTRARSSSANSSAVMAAPSSGRTRSRGVHETRSDRSEVSHRPCLPSPVYTSANLRAAFCSALDGLARIIHGAGNVGTKRLVSSYGDADPKLRPSDEEMAT